MLLPPPKLRDLATIIDATNSTVTTESNVWEIGVPAKKSLYWSVLIGYFLSCDDVRFSSLIEDLKKCDPTASKKKDKLLSSNVSFRYVQKWLRSFNPFKNRHVFFRDSKVLAAFKWKLNQCGNKMLSKGDLWTDEFKLNAASKMLNCEIQVYFPTENKCVSYTQQKKRNLPKIIIFQYPNQTHGSRTENINVFRCSMSVEHAYPLKLVALSHFLKKGKLSSVEIGYVLRLMDGTDAHGYNFIPTILQSPHFNIIPCLYKSPYIALKLSQAGFETNPAVTRLDKPSAFLHAATKTDTKYIRILYDYAANCRYLFEPTVRDPNGAILDSLEILYNIFERDKSMINLCDYDMSTKEQTLSIQREFSSFNKYQQHFAHLIIGLKSELQSGSENMLHVRKKFIQGILSSYTDTKYFYYYSLKSDIVDEFENYLKYTEYYENMDAFTCLTFFDSIHLLKKIFKLPGKDIFALTELRFLLLTVSSKYFPKSLSDVEFRFRDSQTTSNMNENLRLIPFLQREALKEEITKFLTLHESEVAQNEIKGESICTCLSSFPEIRDELIISRIGQYLKAAIEVSLDEDGVKSILVVERALQVLGESIKPQSTEGCVVSCLLATQLPFKLKKELSNIRNDLSHYRDNSALGRLGIESNVEYFKNLQSELQCIQKRFEVVAFSQYLRLENKLIESSKEKIEKRQFDKNTVDQFLHTCEMRLNDRKNNYMEHRKNCIELSIDAIDYLIEYIDFENLLKLKPITKLNESVNAISKSIIYVLEFMVKEINDTHFQPYLEELERYCQEYRNNKKIASFYCIVKQFQAKYKSEVLQIFNAQNSCKLTSQFPTILSLLKSLKQNYISATDINVIVRAANNSYKEASIARDDLVTYINMNSINMSNKEEELLNKLLITKDALKKLKEYFTANKSKPALKVLKKPWISVDSLVATIKNIFKENSAADGIVKSLLVKIMYQRYLKANIYTSAKLPTEIYEILEKFFTKKLNFLLSRIESMKSVLIEEDSEIEDVWLWGRSKEIMHHMRFLMRQRFLREMPVRASLEMAFFDCLNILERVEFNELNEKVNNLFTGINLRHVLAHGHSVLDTVGGLLDEDDLPSELINKILDLIEDYDAIVALRDLIPYANTLEMDIFTDWIKNNNDMSFTAQIQKIKRCKRWENYLFLLPLL